MPLFRPSYLCKTAASILEAAGATGANAARVAESLIDANLVGHDSHGIMRLKEYLEAIRERRIIPNGEPKIEKETRNTLLVNGQYGFGQVVATWAIKRALKKAKLQDMVAAGIFACGHIGRLGEYVEMAAREGYIALAWANGGAKKPRLAPFGGRSPIFGTNPLAAAIPSGGSGAIVIDFSTAAVAAGKLRLAREKNELLPEGWILDRLGRATRVASDYYDGGMLLPAAGHKGYGLALLVEVLAGVLTGAGAMGLAGTNHATNNGVMFWIVRVEAFRGLSEFEAEVDNLQERIKATPPIDVASPVLLPGEPELMTKAKRTAEGIELPEQTWKEICDIASSLGVPIEKAGGGWTNSE